MIIGVRYCCVLAWSCTRTNFNSCQYRLRKNSEISSTGSYGVWIRCICTTAMHVIWFTRFTALLLGKNQLRIWLICAAKNGLVLQTIQNNTDNTLCSQSCWYRISWWRVQFVTGFGTCSQINFSWKVAASPLKQLFLFQLGLCLRHCINETMSVVLLKIYDPPKHSSPSYWCIHMSYIHIYAKHNMCRIIGGYMYSTNVCTPLSSTDSHKYHQQSLELVQSRVTCLLLAFWATTRSWGGKGSKTPACSDGNWWKESKTQILVLTSCPWQFGCPKWLWLALWMNRSDQMCDFFMKARHNPSGPSQSVVSWFCC